MIDEYKLINRKMVITIIHIFNFIVMFLSSITVMSGLFLVLCSNSDTIINMVKEGIIQKGGGIESFNNRIDNANLLGLLLLIVGISLFIARILD